MSYSADGSLQQQALFSIALVLFLFIMMINAALNYFLKREQGEMSVDSKQTVRLPDAKPTAGSCAR